MNRFKEKVRENALSHGCAGCEGCWLCVFLGVWFLVCYAGRIAEIGRWSVQGCVPTLERGNDERWERGSDETRSEWVGYSFGIFAIFESQRAFWVGFAG